jgi:hypothetical protein
MAKSDPINIVRTLTTTNNILLERDSSFEFIAAQMQSGTDKIICIIDGYRLTGFDKKLALPSKLLFDHKKKNKQTKKWEYYYRCSDTDSLYAFFLESVHAYLISQENSSYTGKLVTSESSSAITSILTIIK